MRPTRDACSYVRSAGPPVPPVRRSADPHVADEFDYDPGYLGISRSDDLVIVQIFCNDSRTVDTKKALYRRIVEHLEESPGIRPEDVFINLSETNKVNWSFGNGIAQYAL